MPAVTITDESQVPELLQPVCIGGDILGYSYARSFHRRWGVDPVILSAVDVQVTSSSRLCDYRVVPDLGEPGRLLEELLALGKGLKAAGKLGIVLGSADWHARILSEHAEELSEFYAVPYPDFPLLDRITDKGEFYRICEELSIPYPKTWTVLASEGDLPDDLPFPLVVKPANSAAYDLLEFPGKEKVYAVDDRRGLDEVMGSLARSGYSKEVVLQDFVPGGDSALRSLTVFTDRHGEARVVSGGRVVIQDHSPILIGNPCCIMGERVEQIISDAKRFLAHVGYHGVANFDIKFDERDGSYRFFEVNTRPGRNSWYVTLGGVEFTEPIVRDFVLHDPMEYREAFDPFLYTVVPRKVVADHVADDGLRARALEMFRKGKAGYPYGNPDDTLKHRVLARLLLFNQVRKFNIHLGKGTRV